jgi:hypothetical protein
MNSKSPKGRKPQQQEITETNAKKVGKKPGKSVDTEGDVEMEEVPPPKKAKKTHREESKVASMSKSPAPAKAGKKGAQPGGVMPSLKNQAKKSKI